MDYKLFPEAVNNDFLIHFQKKLKDVESTFNIKLSLRGHKIMYEGNSSSKLLFNHFLDNLIEMINNHRPPSENDLNIILSMAKENMAEEIIREMQGEKVLIRINGKEVHPKTIKQKKYLKSIRNNDLVFAIGPAGTGKTYLAIAMAVNYLLSKKVNRMVLTRPVVEAGEKLGFLPGDIQQKVNPYFRPIYDALYSLIGFDKTAEYIEREIIEIAPLAYMRGRTIDNAFIILDEGQNTLNSQMKMFLTRFGQNSKVVVTADTSQIDLPEPSKSGIFNAIKFLKDIQGIGMITLSARDVIRHTLVQNIINAYNIGLKNRS